MKRAMPILILAVAMAASSASAQNPSWQRTTEPPEAVEVFAANSAFNHPTAQTLGRRNLQIDIAHRFEPPLSRGMKEFSGFDGPANIRLALSYGLSDRLDLGLGRSNVLDNVDLSAKYRLAPRRLAGVTWAVAVQGGMAWTLEQIRERSHGNRHNFQYLAHLIVNARVHPRLALGLVPSYLYNPDVYSYHADRLWTLGLYVQGDLTERASLIVELNPTLDGPDRGHAAASWGLQLETGGHFFKMFVTNTTTPNLAHYLAGSENSFATDEWRFGFLITRVLYL